MSPWPTQLHGQSTDPPHPIRPAKRHLAMPNPPARFDPYYRWLGIAVEEQPPHYYRLLGLNPLESDPEVIALAADRQMSHIKSLAGGKQAEASQKLLNELAHARVELLNAKRKQAYDHQLRQALSAATPPPLAAGATPPLRQQFHSRPILWQSKTRPGWFKPAIGRIAARKHRTPSCFSCSEQSLSP